MRDSYGNPSGRYSRRVSIPRVTSFYPSSLIPHPPFKLSIASTLAALLDGPYAAASAAASTITIPHTNATASNAGIIVRWDEIKRAAPNASSAPATTPIAANRID